MLYLGADNIYICTNENFLPEHTSIRWLVQVVLQQSDMNFRIQFLVQYYELPLRTLGLIPKYDININPVIRHSLFWDTTQIILI
jgi:hypothetical protein